MNDWFQEGAVRPRTETGLDYFDFQVNDGVRWVSLNDHLNFRVGGGSFENIQQSRRRFTVQSSMYDGDWEVHSTASSVTEIVVIDILGADTLQVTDNIQFLWDAFGQPNYTCRKVVNNVTETWRCYPAEWGMDRGMVQTHNVRAQMKLSIPRFPKVDFEATP